MRVIGQWTDGKRRKFLWMRSTRGGSFLTALDHSMLSHKTHHQFGMHTKNAGPSIFATQRRMGVGRTPLHAVVKK
ncbi:MAG: hypothetical protein ACM3UO_00390 [Bacillota bacterium]